MIGTVPLSPVLAAISGTTLLILGGVFAAVVAVFVVVALVIDRSGSMEGRWSSGRKVDQPAFRATRDRCGAGAGPA